YSVVVTHALCFSLVIMKVKTWFFHVFFLSSRRRHTRSKRDWSSDVCSSDLALQDKNGDFNVKVGFSEPRSDGDSNAKIATILEYGKSGQPAKPFLKPARSSSRNACINEIGRAHV